MSGTVGLEFGAATLRAVLRGARGAVRCHAVPFDPARPEEAVAALRARIPAARRAAIAVGLAHLHVKAVSLPPLDATARRAVLRTEPERFFAVDPATPVAVTHLAGAGLALAADARLVAAWRDAVAAWLPVTRVEGAPVALAAALAGAGVADALAPLEAGEGEAGTLALAGGRITGVRRALALPGAAAPAMPVPAEGVDPAFAVAWGAARDAREDDDGATLLLDDAGERARAAERTRTRLGWGAAAAVWVAAAVWAASWSRDQALLAVENALAEARPAARAAEAVMDSVRAIDREIDAIVQAPAGDDALDVLGRVGTRLPADAVAQRVRMVDGAWLVEGHAGTASEALAALAADSRFTDVRFAAPSSRFTGAAGVQRESFAIAFTVR